MLQPLQSKRAKSGRRFESDKLKNNTNEEKGKKKKNERGKKEKKEGKEKKSNGCSLNKFL